MSRSLPKYLFFIFLGLIAYLPFHGFISTWAFTNLGYELWFKSWKEILLLVMVLAAIFLSVDNIEVGKKLWARTINKIIVVYGVLHLVLALFTEQTTEALLHGLGINLRFLAIFLVAQVIVETYKNKLAKDVAVRIMLTVATIASALVILQLILPRDFLEWFGYSKETIPPYFTIDRNLEFTRYASTLRGPNVLGAYLILPVTTITAFFFLKKTWRKIAGAIVMLGAMFFTFSRSAWLGLIASVGTFKIFFAPEHVKRAVRKLLPALLVFVAIFMAVFATTDFIQHTVFHQDPDDVSNVVDSSAEHWQATKVGIEDMIENPLGGGPGTAGPASVRNDGHAKISENYFVQVGQEVGIVGLALFVWINVLLVQALLNNPKKEVMKPVLLCSLLGLTIVSMLLHGWADEEVALTYWGIAGIFAFK